MWALGHSRVSPTFKSLPLKIITAICTRYFLSSRPFFMLTHPLSLPPFVISVRRQTLIVAGPQLQPEPPRPAPAAGLINSPAARIPEASRERACLLPKEAGLSGPLWGVTPGTPSPGLLPAAPGLSPRLSVSVKPFPLFTGLRGRQINEGEPSTEPSLPKMSVAHSAVPAVGCRRDKSHRAAQLSS